ncbi:MAG TPA: flagellin, partial [Firmicutes bacterium]|nr:flagellin [Bacillota bacterium]
MRINTNVSALNSWRQLGMTDKAMGLSLEKLSSGFRINRAADDAAGLAISEKMKAQINGLNQAVRNAQDGISLIQTAEGGLIEVHDMLQRMRTLALQAANGTYDDDLTKGDLAKLDAEFQQLITEIDEVATKRVRFNGKVLFAGVDDGASGTKDLSIQLQIGP